MDQSERYVDLSLTEEASTGANVEISITDDYIQTIFGIKWLYRH